MNRTARTFITDETGTLLPVWAVTFVVFFGIVALSFDLGRVGATQSEFQAYADQVALTAAGELDGRSDAITRATNAAAQLTDIQTYAQGDKALTSADVTLTFYSDLPENDTTAMGAVTTDPRLARYVKATMTPGEVPMTFAAAFASLTGKEGPEGSVKASATAGFAQLACDISPLMFCIPDPSFSAEDAEGHMVRLRSGGVGSMWGPGDFGFLDPSKNLVDATGPCAGLNGVNLDACLIGATGTITQCFSINGVDIEPGQKVGIEDASFNVRFDMYSAIMNGAKNDPAYAPAPNVIRGLELGTNGCTAPSPDLSTDTLGLPRDDCFSTGLCTRYGDGTWTLGRLAYVAANYGVVDPHPEAVTRFDYYKAEIEAAGGGASTTSILTGRSETGRPQCSPHQSDDPNRRVVVAAGIDCVGNAIAGAATNVPVHEFVKIFLTEPVASDGLSPPTLDIWGEIIGPANDGGAGTGMSSGNVRDFVQLYR